MERIWAQFTPATPRHPPTTSIAFRRCALPRRASFSPLRHPGAAPLASPEVRQIALAIVDDAYRRPLKRDELAEINAAGSPIEVQGGRSAEAQERMTNLVPTVPNKWSWGESNPRPSGNERPCYDHSRLTR